VRDKDQAEIHLAHELREQIEDLRLDGNIEGRDRLVGHDHTRFQGQRSRDGDALPLPAGKLMRVFLHEPRREADQLHQLGHTRRDFRVRADGVRMQRLGERRIDGHAGIERGERVLKNHLHVAPHRTDLACAARRQILPFEENRAAGRRHQLHDRARKRGFAAAGLAHEAEHLAPAHGKRDAINSLHRARLALEERPLVNGEMRLHIAELEDRFGHGQSSPRETRPQACQWAGAHSESAAGSARQRSEANSQRSAKAQPGSGFDTSGGRPGIV